MNWILGANVEPQLPSALWQLRSRRITSPLLTYGGYVGDTDSSEISGDIASKVLAVDELQTFNGRLYWIESDREGASIASWSPQDANITRDPFDVGSAAHSYGGGSFVVTALGLLAVASDTGQIWNVTANTQVTDRPGQLGALALSEGGLLAVCDNGTSDELLEIDPASGATRTIHRAPFLASPVVNGTRIAWAQWPEDAAPWNHCEIWSADYVPGEGLSSPALLAGGPEESAVEPKWGPDGDLYFLSDRTGWWNLYRWDAGKAEPVAPVGADCAAAPWELGYSSYAFLESGRVAMLARKGPPARLLICAPDAAPREIPIPFTSIKPYLAALGDRVAIIGSSPSSPAQIALIDPEHSQDPFLVRSSESQIQPPSAASEIHTFESEGNPITLVWHPPSGYVRGPVSTIIRAHPGPTHHVEMRLDADLWYYTEQGFAVIDVDYRGSTGYGRTFRRSLYGQWGDFDAVDCANAARWAFDTGRATPGEVFLIGASAGGFTALNAACLPDNPFTLAVARSAIVDPAQWAAATPRFHRPNARALGGRRIEADRVTIPVLLIHGDDDKVVPIDDVLDLADGLRDKGKQVELLRFPDGGHYLSSAKVKTSVLEAEVDAFRAALNRPGSSPTTTA
jgi:dipeptidyl aminopeptidase/acylaminoacyl peptidase